AYPALKRWVTLARASGGGHRLCGRANVRQEVILALYGSSSLRIVMRRIVLLIAVAVSIPLAAQTGSARPASINPKVRAITAFVRMDRSTSDKQIADALAVLQKLKAEFVSSGYEVETVRLTTQPLTELVAGLSEDQALAFLRQLDERSAKDNFLLNVGPAMLHDSDDPASMQLLEKALSTLPHVSASAIIGDEDGIHWRAIRRTAELVRYVSEHSPESKGTFNFAASAMMKPLSPFFPGSYHTGPGRQFTIGFESANLVQDVFASDKGNAEAAIHDLTAALTKHAQVAEKIGKKVAAETGWSYMGVDPTPAPLGDVSIGAAIEAFTGARFGSSGTLTAARIITTAVKAVPVTQAGYAGLMV